MQIAIRFFFPGRRYGFLSNFSAHGFELDGRYWPTVEHYYQAGRFNNPDLQAKILAHASPRTARRIARQYRRNWRHDWDIVKDDVMRRALRAKFAAAAVRQQLLDTGDAVLIEDSLNDLYWGIGADGTGRNRLGELLMELRQALRQQGGTKS